MATEAFKKVRACVQLLTMVLLLTNLLLLALRCVFYDFMVVERNINENNVFSLEFFYTFTSTLGIMLSFFGACCVNSKIKLYMRVFLVCNFLALCFMTAAIFIVQVIYPNMFQHTYIDLIANSSRSRSLVEFTFNCHQGGANKCQEVVTTYKIRCVRAYVGFTSVSTLLTFLLFFLVRMGSHAQINKDKIKIPTLKECGKVGFSSASLRVKRVIDPVLSAPATV